MRLLVLTVLTVAVLGAATSRFGLVRSVVALTLLGIFTRPRVLLASPALPHVGMAEGSVQITTLTLALLGAGLATIVSRQFPGTYRWYAPFVGFVLVSSCAAWTLSDEQRAGLLQLALGLSAWGVGRALGSSLARDERLALDVLWLTFAALVVQSSLALLQLAGLAATHTDRQTAELVQGRVSGTFSHPDNLGKAMVLLLCLILPFLIRAERPVRRLALCNVMLALLTVILTGGRADILAAVSLVALYGLLQPRLRSVGQRLLLPGLSLAAGSVFVLLFFSRITADPQGGSRGRLTDVALRVLPEHPIAGVGPNSYVTAAGRFDSLTATGWPVHNTFLLVAVELGVLGAALWFAPLFLVMLQALRRYGAPGMQGAAARTLLCAGPGIVVICLTGWGMMAGPILPLWLLVFGALSSMSGSASPPRSDRRLPRTGGASAPRAGSTPHSASRLATGASN